MAAFINREIFLQTSRRRKSFSSAPKRASVTRKCYACLLFMSRCIYFCGNKPFKGARHNVSARGVYQPVIYKIAAGLRWNVEAAFLCRFRNKNQTRAHIYKRACWCRQNCVLLLFLHASRDFIRATEGHIIVGPLPSQFPH